MAQKLINLDTTTYEHPFDKAALEKVNNYAFIDRATSFVMDWTSVKWQMVQYAGSCFHVTSDSCPDLYNKTKNVADILDIAEMPDIYTNWSYLINAFTTGFKRSTMLVMNTGTVDLMTDNELAFVIGHEMGHIKSGHVLYHQMLRYISVVMDALGLAAAVAGPFKLALLYWYRMSEFTADRAGLLACQDIDAAMSSIIKMSGIPQKYFNEINKETILTQAENFQTKFGDFFNKTIKNISILDDSHPWTVLRAAELIKWYDSGAYSDILNSTVGIKCPRCNTVFDPQLEKCPVCGWNNSK